MPNQTKASPGELLSFTVPPGETVTYTASAYSLFVITKLQGWVIGSPGDQILFTKNITTFAGLEIPAGSTGFVPILADVWMLIAEADVLKVESSGGASVTGFATGWWWAPGS